LKKRDSQRIWIFTNNDNPQTPDAEEAGRIQKQVQVGRRFVVVSFVASL